MDQLSNQCGICLGTVRGKYPLTCRHEFCTLCLLELQEHREDNIPLTTTIPCPTCRQPLPRINPSPIYNINIYNTDETPSTQLSEHELGLVSTHFETTFTPKSWNQVDLGKYTVFHHVQYQRLLVGYLTNITETELVLSKCILIERKDGRLYPTHPRVRDWKYDQHQDEIFQC